MHIHTYRNIFTVRGTFLVSLLSCKTKNIEVIIRQTEVVLCYCVTLSRWPLLLHPSIISQIERGEKDPYYWSKRVGKFPMV